MKVVVLAGGTSPEREISIVSGRCVCEALQERGHRAVLLDCFFGCSDEEAEHIFEKITPASEIAKKMNRDTERLEKELASGRPFFGSNVLRVCRDADRVFLALHGANGEDGKVQAAFDLCGIRYTGAGYLSSALAMDKEFTRKLFRADGIRMPRGGAVHQNDADLSYHRFALELPVIVKPCCGGSSVGTSVASTDEEYEKALHEAFFYEERAIVEEFIRGREFSVAVVAGEAWPVIEIAPKNGFYDYQNKYVAGLTEETCPAEISAEKTAEMQKMATDGAAALGISTYCRLDFMMDVNGGIYCLEANTLPGMTPMSLVPQEAAALGMSFPDLCERLLSL